MLDYNLSIDQILKLADLAVVYIGEQPAIEVGKDEYFCVFCEDYTNKETNKIDHEDDCVVAKYNKIMEG